MFLGVCQKCRVPLKVNCNKPLQESSLLAFTGTGLAGLDGPPPLADETQAKHASAVRMLGESFVVLADGGAGGAGGGGGPAQGGNSRAAQSTDLDRKITALTNIFEVASDKCQFDHPLCGECSQAIFKELDRRLEEHKGDGDMYEAALKGLVDDQAGSAEPGGPTACFGDCGGTCDGGDCERKMREEEVRGRPVFPSIMTNVCSAAVLLASCVLRPPDGLLLRVYACRSPPTRSSWSGNSRAFGTSSGRSRRSATSSRARRRRWTNLRPGTGGSGPSLSSKRGSSTRSRFRFIF